MAANALVRCCFHAYADSSYAKQVDTAGSLYGTLASERITNKEKVGVEKVTECGVFWISDSVTFSLSLCGKSGGDDFGAAASTIISGFKSFLACKSFNDVLYYML